MNKNLRYPLCGSPLTWHHYEATLAYPECSVPSCTNEECDWEGEPE